MQGTNSAYVVFRLLCKLTAIRVPHTVSIVLFKIHVLLYILNEIRLYQCPYTDRSFHSY